MKLYLFDTNMASYAIKKSSQSLQRRMETLSQEETICVSCITEGELRFGLERKPGATSLRKAVEDFLRLATPLPWGSSEAAEYAKLRSMQIEKGRPLALLDTMIASHAITMGATLVTHDRDFRHIGGMLRLEDWATDLP